MRRQVCLGRSNLCINFRDHHTHKHLETLLSIEV
ncbi:unnamed protein product [Musa acuminata subsp. malaccensis]|uniref:(wild Malaysian banana) hypothetical protein n=1 Tax=Musa acuminata subsp. malaccensis TaxID=214687 RepID=A0A804K264_MUSAM|nr:unnamed protein product [Musa acuminata subsp. malaccensis]